MAESSHYFYELLVCKRGCEYYAALQSTTHKDVTELPCLLAMQLSWQHTRPTRSATRPGVLPSHPPPAPPTHLRPPSPHPPAGTALAELCPLLCRQPRRQEKTPQPPRSMQG